MTQVPLAPPPPSKDQSLDRWLWLLWRRLTAAGQVLWDSISFTGSNLTDIETRNHDDLQNIQGGASGDNYHLTSAEKTGLVGASYLTLGTNTALTSERVFTLGTGLSGADAGAGSTYTLAPVAFVGDTGSGGAIGAVPAPATGDAAAGKYLRASGVWLNPADAGDITHNILQDLQGGLVSGVFQTGVFQTGVFQQGTIEYYHVSAAHYNELDRQEAVTTVSVDTTMTDDYATYIVDTSAKTITLPEAIPSRFGKEWTVIMDCTGYVDVAPDPSDEIIIPGGSDTIRLDQIGSNVTLKCVTATQWAIV